MKFKNGDTEETIEVKDIESRLKVDQFYGKLAKLVNSKLDKEISIDRSWFKMMFQGIYPVNADGDDIRKLRIGDLGINRYSEITFSVQEIKVKYQAAVDIKFFHQPYFKFKAQEPGSDFKAFSFDDCMEVKAVIAELAKNIDDTDLPETLKGVKNLSLYD